MKRTFLKPLLAAAVAASALTTSVGAHDRALLLQHTAAPSLMMRPAFSRVFDRAVRSDTIVRAPAPVFKLSFDCVVAGTPVEFPNDIRISNPYDFSVAAGTVAFYSAPYGNTGTVTLPALAPGAGIYVSNAVPGGITAGTPCSASQL